MRTPHLLLSSLLFVTLASCGGGGGGDGPKRYEVQGKVTYKGEPVPYGQINFEPDSSKGNKGPGVGATIENGNYSLNEARGVVSGALRVSIIGYDGIAPPGGGLNMHGKPLFPQYSTSVEQPTSAATHDFDVKGK